MPVFHTKTIKSILEPVAQQVSKLVILHEEAEDGNAMPDLSRPVQVVKMAVDNLIKVGYETTNSSNDTQLKEDMPPALKRVEDSCGALLQASNIINSDPYSSIARAKLIEGSRGILQGTSALLVAFDESEVRKIIRVCQHVLEYLSIVEVIDNLEDLVTFVKNLSPVLTRMTKEVDVREKELTHQVHREYLQRSLEQVKHLTPSLITSVKIYVTSKNHQDGGSLDDALSSRNYVTEKLTNEVHEIIRVLQLQTYDEVGWEGDDVMAVKKAQNAMDHKMKLAHDWLSDPSSAVGLSGDHAARSILHDADIIISKCAEDADDEVIEEVAAIKKTASNIASMMDALSELKQHGDGNSTQALSLARGIEEGLKEVQSRCSKVVQATDRLKSRDTAHTMAGKLKQAQQWLSNRNKQFTPAGHQAVKQLAEDGMRIAGNMGAGKEELEQLCTQVQMLVDQLAHASSSNQGDSPQAKQTAITLSHKLKNLKQKLQDSVVAMVAEDFMDISTPLKALSEAAVVSLEEPKREENFEEKALNFSNNTERLVSTARQLARVAVCGNRRVVEALSAEAQMLEDLLPQLVKAGRMLLHNPSNQVLQEHYDVLKGHAAEGLERLRCLADEAIDAESFISCNETGMRKDTERAEESLKADDRLSFVNHTSRVARRAHRILQVAQSEAENSDDPRYVDVINHASTQLRNNIAPMIQEAKFTAQNPHNATNTNMWRSANNKLLDRVGEVRNAVTDREYGRDFPDVAGLNISKDSRSSSNSNHQQHYNHQQQYNKNQHNNHNTYDNQLHNSHNAYKNQQLNKHYPNTPSSPTSSSPHSFQYSRDEDYYRGYNNENPPPRPPLPLDTAPPRPPPPETDDEFEVSFPSPQTNQPIMMAAHALHNDVKQWSSRDNDLIAAAKKMALLMAKLSMLVRGEGGGKKDLIACAKAVAQASDEVTELAKKLAQECTDKRMRMHLLQVCERIPTIGTQLKILSTVKATMIGAQGSEEDEEATEMLVGNAQNLMQAVRETLVCAEAASIKIRIDSGYSIKWLRKRPWYA